MMRFGGGGKLNNGGGLRCVSPPRNETNWVAFGGGDDEEDDHGGGVFRRGTKGRGFGRGIDRAASPDTVVTDVDVDDDGGDVDRIFHMDNTASKHFDDKRGDVPRAGDAGGYNRPSRGDHRRGGHRSACKDDGHHREGRGGNSHHDGGMHHHPLHRPAGVRRKRDRHHHVRRNTDDTDLTPTIHNLTTPKWPAPTARDRNGGNGRNAGLNNNRKVPSGPVDVDAVSVTTSSSSGASSGYNERTDARDSSFLSRIYDMYIAGDGDDAGGRNAPMPDESEPPKPPPPILLNPVVESPPQLHSSGRRRRNSGNGQQTASLTMDALQHHESMYGGGGQEVASPSRRTIGMGGVYRQGGVGRTDRDRQRGGVDHREQGLHLNHRSPGRHEHGGDGGASHPTQPPPASSFLDSAPEAASYVLHGGGAAKSGGDGTGAVLLDRWRREQRARDLWERARKRRESSGLTATPAAGARPRAGSVSPTACNAAGIDGGGRDGMIHERYGHLPHRVEYCHDRGVGGGEVDVVPVSPARNSAGGGAAKIRAGAGNLVSRVGKSLRNVRPAAPGAQHENYDFGNDDDCGRGGGGGGGGAGTNPSGGRLASFLGSRGRGGAALRMMRPRGGDRGGGGGGGTAATASSSTVASPSRMLLEMDDDGQLEVTPLHHHRDGGGGDHRRHRRRHHHHLGGNLRVH